MAEQPQSWTRIRPRRRTIDPGVGLAARVADPLWLLCRQMQMGEFAGDDGATPTSIRITAKWAPFTHWRPGSLDVAQDWLPYDRDRPLEALVEDDRTLVGGQAPPMLAAVEAGQRLQRRLRAGLPALALGDDIPRIVMPARPSALATHVHAGMSVDGFRVRGNLAAIRIALAAGLSADEKRTLDGLLDEWSDWFDRRFGATGIASSWVQERLEYRFALAAPDPRGGPPLVFAAPEYLGTGVDWSELDLVEGVEPPGGVADGLVDTFVETRKYPQSLRWPGMPVDRFWEMEDGAVDLGALSLDPADLPGMLALDMAATGSTDWFLTELPLPTGGVAWIEEVVVTDTFGRTTVVTDAGVAADIGLLFAPGAAQRAGAGLMVIAPRLGARVDGPAREEIMLVRDELANVGWIIEQTGPGEDGEPATLEWTPRPEPPPSPAGSLHYRLSTGAPEHWIPLVPRRRKAADDERLELVRGTVYGQDPAGLTVTMLARQIDAVLDEEVPREGKRIGRAWQYTRWYDGSRHLWSGRTIRAGRGEANSALRFDDTF